MEVYVVHAQLAVQHVHSLMAQLSVNHVLANTIYTMIIV